MQHISRISAVALVFSLLLGCNPSAEERRGSIYDLKREPTPENQSRIRGMLDDPDRDFRLHITLGPDL